MTTKVTIQLLSDASKSVTFSEGDAHYDDALQLLDNLRTALAYLSKSRYKHNFFKYLNEARAIAADMHDVELVHDELVADIDTLYFSVKRARFYDEKAAYEISSDSHHILQPVAVSDKEVVFAIDSVKANFDDAEFYLTNKLSQVSVKVRPHFGDAYDVFVDATILDPHQLQIIATRVYSLAESKEDAREDYFANLLYTPQSLAMLVAGKGSQVAYRGRALKMSSVVYDVRTMKRVTVAKVLSQNKESVQA